MKNLLSKYISFLINEEITKSGKEIKIKVEEKSTARGDQLDRGWIVHRFLALDAKTNEELGYLKVSYIPREKFLENFDIIYYVNNINGSGRRLDDSWENLPLKDQVKHLDSTLGEWPYHTDKINEFSERQMEELKIILLKKIKDKHKKHYEQFVGYHIDKPLVDYIMVYEKNRRQGIAIVLYEFAAKWLAKHKRLKLYASGLQSKEAEAAWRWLRAEKYAHIGTETSSYDKSKKRTFLDFVGLV
jgi:GNAT superfamily N-acetyltransferase